MERTAILTNATLISDALSLIRLPIAYFACSRLQSDFDEDWWLDGVVGSLTTAKRPTVDDVIQFWKLPESVESVSDGADALDVLNCLDLLRKHAFRFFGDGEDLAFESQRFAQELIGVRHQYSHQNSKASIKKSASGDFASDYTWRAVDTMYRLLHSIDPEIAADLLALRSRVDLSEYGHPGAAPEESAATVAKPAEIDRIELSDEQAGPDFSSQDLRHMDFSNANLAGANLSGADLRGAKFSGANLRNAILVKPRMADQFPGSAVKLAGADLAGAKLDFRGTDLRHVDFGGLDLSGADLSGADLRGAWFSGTNLTNAIIVKARMADQYPGSAVHISGADLTGATLNFRDTDLRYVDLSGHDFSNVDFTGADLRGADLSDAVLNREALKKARVSDQYPASATVLKGVKWV
jgi:uncharacterized protein YjbI with pentapeptide repeats